MDAEKRDAEAAPNAGRVAARNICRGANRIDSRTPPSVGPMMK
jgi:hypothetical protein